MKRLLSTVSSAVLLGAVIVAQAPATRSSISTERLARIDPALQKYVDDNRIAGAVALVLQDGKPIYERAVGWSDKEAGRRMTTDTIFRIASQTKAITSAAILVLMEEGKLGLTDPVSRFIAPFASTTVAEPNGESNSAPVPARRQIQIRDLLTHTAGISYGTDRHVAPLYEAKGLGACSRLWLVHRRQERADLRNDGAAGDAPLRCTSW